MEMLTVVEVAFGGESADDGGVESSDGGGESGDGGGVKGSCCCCW